LKEARELVRATMEDCETRHITDWNRMKNLIRESLSEFVWKKTKRRPMIQVIFLEV
jgi:ribonuclease J